MDQIHWNLIPADLAARGNWSHQREYSHSRMTDAVDFVWYDPWTPQPLTSEQARHLRHNPRAPPPTLPTSYVFEPDAAVIDYMSECEDADISEEPYKMETEDPLPEDQIAAAPQPVHVGNQHPQQNPADDETELKLLRRFLEEAGVPLTSLQGDRQNLAGLLRAHHGQGANEPSA